MVSSILLGIAVFAYLVATISIHKSGSAATEQRMVATRNALMVAFCALTSHLAYVTLLVSQQGALDFSLSSMSAVVSLLLVGIFMLGCLGMEIARLGILVFPLAGLSLVFSFFWSGETAVLSGRQLLPISAFSAHVMVSVLAYCLLAIATIQALLFRYQEQQIKNRAAPSVLSALPPLQTMEQLLFRLIWMGFILLTLALLSGAVFGVEIFGQPFEFNHHTVLALLGWIVFAALLVQKIRGALLGSHAVIWTVAGFLLIQLGYFGTKFINESMHL